MMPLELNWQRSVIYLILLGFSLQLSNNSFKTISNLLRPFLGISKLNFWIIKNCFKQEDHFIKISLCGLATLLIFQTFIHAGVNTNLIPTTGMTLPFLSYGGSSLIGSAILAGVVLNYTKNKAHLYD